MNYLIRYSIVTSILTPTAHTIVFISKTPPVYCIVKIFATDAEKTLAVMVLYKCGKGLIC